MTVLHVLNGDTTRVGLEQAGLPGDICVFADVLHDGRVPSGFDAESLAQRARALATLGYGSFEEMHEHGRRWQAALDRHADYDDVVLWLEHDLFDQLLLIRHLAFFDGVQRTRGLQLISSGDYLGPMEPAQLARLYSTREPVSAAQRDLGVRAWRAFTSDDAMELQRVADEDTRVLPFLHDALVRMLEEYPSSGNGLGRLDQQILELLSERAASPAQLFAQNAGREESIFLGDTTFFLHLEQLARCAVPLLELDSEVRITSAGREVVAGKADAIALNGIDRWIGGVYLTRDRVWRRDATARRLLPRS